MGPLAGDLGHLMLICSHSLLVHSGLRRRREESLAGVRLPIAIQLRSPIWVWRLLPGAGWRRAFAAVEVVLFSSMRVEGVIARNSRLTFRRLPG